MKTIIGCDEAGRGAWAGPLVAAAVSLKKGKKFGHPLIRDSKKLSPEQRQEVFVYVHDICQVGLGVVSVAEINKLGLQRSNVLAVERAIEHLQFGVGTGRALSLPKGVQIVIDHIGGFKNYTGLKNNYFLHKFGESKFPEIAAASIIAKVSRDKLMIALAKKMPSYYFDQHKGYGTEQHIKTLRHYGVSKAHRLHFKPIEMLLKNSTAPRLTWS